MNVAEKHSSDHRAIILDDFPEPFWQVCVRSFSDARWCKRRRALSEENLLPTAALGVQKGRWI
jgi:hypothetical protein